MKKLFKNIITMTLATVMAGSFMIVSANENNPDNPENYLAGDIVSDGKVNIKDASEIQKYLTNQSTVKYDFDDYNIMDFNGDGVVNVRDVADIQKKTVKKKYNYANNFYPVNYVTDEVDGSKMDFTLQYKKDNYNGEDNNCLNYKTYMKHYVTTVIKTYDEYTSFFSSGDKFDESFFNDNALVFVYRRDANYKNSYELKNISVKDNQLNLDFDVTYKTKYYAESFTSYNFFYSVKKSNVANIDTINVYQNMIAE